MRLGWVLCLVLDVDMIFFFFRWRFCSCGFFGKDVGVG